MSDSSKPRLLIVDDEEKVARLLQYTLEQNGYRVSIQQDGLRAWQEIERDPPQLILCDLLLPHLHGFEICKRVKSSEALKHIPVLLMTAVYKTTKYKSEAVTYGADDFLIKPVNQVDLLASIRRFLHAEPAPQSNAQTEGFSDQLRMLRREYIMKLPERLIQIRANWDTLTGGQWNVEGFRDLHRTVHGIAGTSATFGLVGLSNAARGVEKTVEKCAEKGEQPHLQLQMRITTLLEELGQAATLTLATETKQPTPAPTPVGEAKKGPASDDRVALVTSDTALATSLQQQLALFEVPIDVISDAASLMASGSQPPSAGAWIIDAGCGAYPAVLERISSGPQSGRPVVVLSEATDLEARVRASQAGATALIGKPPDLADLIGHVTESREEVAPAPGRVLILGRDEAEDIRICSVLEGAGMSTCLVADPSEVMGPLSEFQADVLLLDQDLPAVSSTELVRALRFEKDHRHIPAIFFGSTPTPDAPTARMGQIDYFLKKPFHSECLIELTRCCVRQSRAADRGQLVDGLTGLRVGGFWDAEEDDLAGARRASRALSFAMVEIDRLESVNSEQGHAAGDRALATIACLLKRRLRDSGRLGRLTGSSFGVALAGMDGADAAELLRQVCAAATRLKLQGGRGLFVVTLSCGIASFPQFGDAAALSQAARQALDAARRQNGNRIVLAHVPSKTVANT